MSLGAHLVCIGFTFIYVAGFYLFNIPGERNDPPVIRARMTSVMIASMMAACMVRWYSSQRDLVAVLGIGIPTTFCGLFNLLKPLLLTVLLFLGPLTISYFDKVLPFQTYFSFQEDVKPIFMSLIGQRNYIVAPLTEEFVFRACMIAVLFEAGYSKLYLIFASPLYFGFAHLHHAWDVYRKLGKTRHACKVAVLSSLFQFTYTSLFGWYESYLFLKFGSIWPPVLCHSFCNLMGFPELGQVSFKSTLQKNIIYGAFVLGLVLFIFYFSSLTKGESMYWK